MERYLADVKVDKVIFTSRYSSYCVSEKELLKGAGIIIPVRRVQTPFELKWYELVSIGRMLVRAKTFIDSNYHPDGYNIGWNVGTVAGQKFMHAHLHVIPRYKGDSFEGKGLKKSLMEHIL